MQKTFGNRAVNNWILAQQFKGQTAQLKNNTTGMPDPLKSGIESLSGMDLSDVRVHYNSAKPAHIHALAYAQGNDIHLGPGQEKHLPHEAWHVVQQRQGRVRPTMQMKANIYLNDETALEREADLMGEKALRGEELSSVQPKQNAGTERPVLQAKFTGSYGALLNQLSPDHLDVANTFYNSLWTSLQQSDKEIQVEEGPPSYSQEKETLYFKGTVLKGLLKLSFENLAEKASHISSLTHELSHVHDHRVNKRFVSTAEKDGLDKHTSDVLDTELRAWAREALVAFSIAGKGEKQDAEKKQLIDGWIGYSDDLLENVSAAKETNYLIKRLFKYTCRELRADSVETVQKWFNTQRDNEGDWLRKKINHLKIAIEKYM